MNSQFDSIFSRILFAVCAGGATVSFAAYAGIPDVLATPANQVVLLEAKADGVQIYECKTKQNNPTGNTITAS